MSFINRGGLMAALALLCAGAWMPAQAQSLLMNDLGNGFQGAASLDTAYVHTDNYFYSTKTVIPGVPGSGNPAGASGYFVRPTLMLDRDVGTLSVKFRASGEYSNFDVPEIVVPVQSENLDGVASTSLDWTLGTRNRLGLFAEFRHSHDSLGLLRPTGVAPLAGQTELGPDQWNQGYYTGKYRIGAPEAALNFEVHGSDRDRTYVNNHSGNNDTRYLDFNTVGVGGTLFFNYSPKTALLLDYDHYHTLFDELQPGAQSRNNEQDIYRVGIQWKATAKTTGDVRVGYSTQDFEAARRQVDNLNWLASLTWTPAVRSTFSLMTGRTSQESYLVRDGDEALNIDNQDTSLEWAQHWGSRFTTFTVARYVHSKFDAEAKSPSGVVNAAYGRKDDIRSFSVTAEYALIKYLTLIGSVTHTNRDSSIDSAEYETTLTFIGLRLIP